MPLKTAAIVILILGELNFTGLAFLQEYQKSGYDAGFVFSKTSECIKQADIVIANLEGPLTFSAYSEEANKKLWKFKQLPLFAGALKSSGINTLLLANNHIADAGEDGINDTLKYLKSNDINWVPPPKEGPLIIKQADYRIEIWNVDIFSPPGSHPWALEKERFIAMVGKYNSVPRDRTISMAFIHSHTESLIDKANLEDFILELKGQGVAWIILGGSHRASILSNNHTKGATHYGLGDFVFGCECSGEASGKALSLTILDNEIQAKEIEVITGNANTGYIAEFADSNGMLLGMNCHGASSAVVGPDH